MSVSARGAEDETPQTTPVAGDGATDGQLLGAFGSPINSDHCANCGAALAPDQRYCVECGARRGKPRFSLDPVSRSAPGEVAASVPPPRRSHWSPNATLLAGLAVLLLAIGVGVLIGESGSNTVKSPGVHVTVNGGGGASSSGAASSTPAATSNTGSGSGTKSSSKSSSKSKSKAASTAKARAKAATPPPSSGVSTTVSKAPAVKPGGACAAGTAGCQGGKETGNYFGG